MGWSKLTGIRKVELEIDKDGKWIPCNNTQALDIGIMRTNKGLISSWTFYPIDQFVLFTIWFFGLVASLIIQLFFNWLPIKIILAYITFGMLRLSVESLWWTVKLYRGEIVENTEKIYSHIG